MCNEKNSKYLTNIAKISLKSVGEKELYMKLKDFAKKRGLKLYFILRQALIEYLEKHEND